MVEALCFANNRIESSLGKHDRGIHFLADKQERLVPFQVFLDTRKVRNKPRLHVGNGMKESVPGNQFLACCFFT